MADRIVKVDGMEGIAAAIPGLMGHVPRDEHVVVATSTGKRFNRDASILPPPFRETTEYMDRVIEIVMAEKREHHPDATTLLVFTFGPYPDVERVVPDILAKHAPDYNIVHGHVQDGMFTPIYPAPGPSVVIPAPPRELSLDTAAYRRSVATSLALWDRTPLDVPAIMVEAATADAQDMVANQPARKIAAAAGLHLDKIANPSTSDSIRDASVVAVAAVLAADKDVHDLVVADARHNATRANALNHVALHAPTAIAGEVATSAGMLAYADGSLTQAQARHLLDQVPATRLGSLLYTATAMNLPPKDMGKALDEAGAKILARHQPEREAGHDVGQVTR